MGRTKTGATAHNLSILPSDWRTLLAIHPSPSEALRIVLAMWRAKK